MKISALTDQDCPKWGQLLAVCFARQEADMVQLLHFLQPEERLVAFGAWDGDQLAAQYSCWLTAVHLPGCQHSLPVGMSINMAVHPAYRGRGLVKQVSAPVYETLRTKGVAAGVGFSNAAGVQVDKHSRGYGYQVVGRLRPWFACIRRRPNTNPASLTDTWPAQPFAPVLAANHIHFVHTPETLKHRFAGHPFRQYHFGVWAENGQVYGLVVYRPVRFGLFTAVALLAVYGMDVPELLRRWLAALQQTGVRLIHVLATPGSSIVSLLRQTAVCLPQPYTRSPYYLTLKPLVKDVPSRLFDFTQWACQGGDVL